jgi:hypothetical protein
MRPFRFFAAVQDVMDGAELSDLARRAEATGYSALLVPDHLAIPQLSPIPAMTAIALATTTLRTGGFVLNNDLRHPATLAQDLASLDQLSGGRATLTLAAREAQIVGLAPRVKGGRADPASITFAGVQEKIGWVRDAAGDRFADLELNTYPSTWPVTVTDDPRGEAQKVVDTVREGTGTELTVNDVLDSPHVFIGTIDSLTEKVQGLRERLGISSFLFGDLDTLAPVVRRLAGS